ncbi:MAG: hypothetical protein M1815_006304, partial [Lichina confinis]
ALFPAFTDSLSSNVTEQRLKANARVITSVLRTWPGIMVLSMYNFRTIRSLVQALRFPHNATQDTLLELFFDLLRIKLPSWSSSFLAGRRLTTYGRVANLRSEDTSQTTYSPPEDQGGQQNLVDHFLALTLALLFESGFQQVMLTLLNGHLEPLLRRKATLLLGEALKMASRLLPDKYNVQSQMLPELFTWASNFGTEKRYLATSTIYQIDSVNRTLQRSSSTHDHPAGKTGGALEGRDRSRSTDQPRLQISTQIDETNFRNHMVDSQVLNSTNHLKWKWDVLQAIVEGPLMNAKRLDEAVRATKFLRRLLGFYRPFKLRFSDIRNTKPNQRYVRVGCALIKTLLQSNEGVKQLIEYKFMEQLSLSLGQLDPRQQNSPPTTLPPIFSPIRLAETLSAAYFTFLGTMSKEPNGIRLLEQWRIINRCYYITDLEDRNDLVKLLLGNLDFSLPSHFRIILSKALTGSTKEIRIFATNLLRPYAIHDAQPGNHAGPNKDGAGHSDWAIRLLITQLYDPEVEVCETAVKILEEACNKIDCLEFVVRCCPALDHLGEIGAPLLLRFLSTSLGYRYLDDLDYITQEMDDWFLGRNDTYVTLVEASIARAIHEPEKRRQGSDGSGTAAAALAGRRPPSIAPPHFYRELTRTTEGCRLLRDKGHFGDFVETIREYGLEKDDAETIVKVKGCLWAVGNVGSMELGAPFIEEWNVVDVILRVAESSEVLSMRGTAFFVLGLISRSLHGSEMLMERGWDGASTTMGESLGRFIPLHLGRIFSLRPWPHDPYKASAPYPRIQAKDLAVGEDATNTRILELIIDLGSTVLTKRAVSDLMHIKSKKPRGFQDSNLFRKALTVLEAHHYRLPVRRFIIDLFDKNILRRIVLDDDDDDDDEDEDDGDDENDDHDDGGDDGDDDDDDEELEEDEEQGKEDDEEEEKEHEDREHAEDAERTISSQGWNLAVPR